MNCPVCGEKNGTCHGSAPVRLTADQLKDIGLKPDQLTAGGTITMADQNEPKARYPKQEVSKGQKHGYIGDVEVYEPTDTAGRSNVTHETAEKPAEPAIVGDTGVIGTVDYVAPKK